MTSPEALIGKAAGHYASGNLESAANLCRRVLKGWPRHAEALHLLGVVTYKAGNPERATRYLEDALALLPSDPEITRNLAFAQRDSGEPDGAAENFRKAIGLDPSDTVSHFQLGVLLGEREKPRDAIPHFDAVLERDTRNWEALYNRAKALLAIGRFAEAENGFAQAARLLPADYRIFVGWGNALHQLERYEEAREHFQMALDKEPPTQIATDLTVRIGSSYLESGAFEKARVQYETARIRDPGNGAAAAGLAAVLLAIGRFAEAENGFAQAARLLPADYRLFIGWGNAHHMLEQYKKARERYQMALDKGPPAQTVTNLTVAIGDSYLESGAFEKARAQYETARKRDPGNAAAAASLAALYAREGDYQRSYDLVRPFASDDPPSVAAAITFAQVAPRFGETGEAIERLQAASAQISLRPHQKQRLHFALGKLRDSVGEFETAFRDYRTANELYVDSHDPAAHTQATDQKIEAVGHAEVARLRLREALSDRPVFILGMPRSGTSLVEQILASHPRVAGGGELLALPNIVRALPGQLGVEADYRSVIGRIDTDTVAKIARTYLAALQAVDPDASRVTDKVPNNFEHLWLIAAAFPGAPILHCTRHPLDTCLSCYFQDFVGRVRFSRDLNHLGRRYVDYRRLMGHWGDTLDLNMMEVAYEEMVQDTEALSRRIVEFCGLDWDPGCLKFYENKRFVATASYEQVRRPIYTQSVGRYRHYEPYIGELMDALQVAGI